MNTEPKYDRDKLVDLLAERATFEKNAVGLYDLLLSVLEDVDDEVIVSSMDQLRRYREEELEHAQWLEGLLRDLGGKPTRIMTDAVTREARGLVDVVKRGKGEPLPLFHAMLASELMDLEGWKLLLEVAQNEGDDRAVRELRTRVRREQEHLALVRRIMATLEMNSVELRADGGARGGAVSNGNGRRIGQRAGHQERAGHQRAGQGRGGSVAISSQGRATTDHDIIRRWVEARGGSPAHVKRTGSRDDLGILRIDFPGFSGAQSLEHVDWDRWFRAFDENGLAFIYEEKTADGKPSRFNKLVARDTIQRRMAGQPHASVHDRRIPGTRRGGAGARSSRSSRGAGSSQRTSARS